MSDSVDDIDKSDILLSYLQLQLVLTVLHNKTNKREILVSIAMSRKKIDKILSSLVSTPSSYENAIYFKTAIILNFFPLTWSWDFI